MRTLARTVANVVASELRTGASIGRSGSDAMLMSLARDVTRTRIDLVHFPIIYYFAAVDWNASIAYWTPQLVRWAEDGISVDRPAHVRLAAATFDGALTDLAALLGARFLRREFSDRDAVFRAFALEQGVAA